MNNFSCVIHTCKENHYHGELLSILYSEIYILLIEYQYIKIIISGIIIMTTYKYAHGNFYNILFFFEYVLGPDRILQNLTNYYKLTPKIICNMI